MSGVPPHKRNVNTVFQSYALFPFLNVFNNVAFGLRYQKLSRQQIASKVHEALDLVQLRSYEKRRRGAGPAESVLTDIVLAVPPT